jgi:transmembrane protein TMEM220
MPRHIWQFADVLFLLMFALSVVVQFNDPDPIRWSAMYAAAALVCLLSLIGRVTKWQPLVVGAIALVWALTIAPRVVGKVNPGEMFSAWEMKNAGVEESREMYGLLLVSFWMALVAVRAERSAKRAQRT